MDVPLHWREPQKLHRAHLRGRPKRLIAHLLAVLRAFKALDLRLVRVRGGKRLPALAVSAGGEGVLGDPLIFQLEGPCAASGILCLLAQGQIAHQLQHAVALRGVLAPQDFGSGEFQWRHLPLPGLDGLVDPGEQQLEKLHLGLALGLVQLVIVQLGGSEFWAAAIQSMVTQVRNQEDVVDEPHGRALVEARRGHRIGGLQELVQERPRLLPRS
mmetsp:Transcript_50655/g.120902  ORF Transcript_50655/g.120902 Transcript_50655/m.120902 type:complete len:214 (+) Transcript_50655:819-1460(+)